jgi:hypothetical protein
MYLRPLPPDSLDLSSSSNLRDEVRGRASIAHDLLVGDGHCERCRYNISVCLTCTSYIYTYWSDYNQAIVLSIDSVFVSNSVRT